MSFSRIVSTIKKEPGLFNIEALIILSQKFGMNNLFSIRNFKTLRNKKYKCGTCGKELTCKSAWTVKWTLPFDKNAFCKKCAKLQKIVEAL